jgi:predicted amidophosphoribosyltransferase
MKCPVCQAGFRATRRCSRCRADLEPLMLLAAKAWQLRQSARQALAGGQLELATRLAKEAQNARRTRAGESLRLLSRWLSRGS